MAKALKIAAIVVGVVALTVATAGLAAPAATAAFLGSIATGLTVTTALTALSIAGTLLSLAAGVLAKPPKLKSDSSQQLQWVADPAAGEPYVMGDAMVGASIVHQASWGDKNKFLGIVGVLSLGTIFAYDGLYADMTQVTFSGRNATGYYANFLYESTQLGAMPESAALNMTAPDGSTMPDWGAAYQTSGLATAGLVLVADVDNGKVYSGGTPQFTNRIRGVLAYDPRLDSTQTGGSGAQRPLNESTYQYSENPWTHAVTYALGRWQNGVKMIGPGLAAAQIDMAAFMEAANIADFNGWKISGQVFSTDDKWSCLKAICQAGGGYPMPSGAHLSCFVNAPRVSIATLYESDVKGPVSAPQMPTRRSRYNGAIPRARLAAQGWQVTALDAVRNSTYLAQDGGNPSTEEFELSLVADKGDGAGKNQAAQLAAYEVANSRERFPISVELGYAWSQYKLGDCITLNLASANLVNQKCVVIGRTINPSKNTVTLVFRTEDDAKHTWALGVGGSATIPPAISQPHGNGDNGSTSLNNASVFLYQRASSAPATPSVTTTYTFATGALAGANNGWTQAIPAANGNPLWVTLAAASNTGTTDTIAAGEWASPVIFVQDGSGTPGSNGLQAATVFLYQRASSAPAVPSTTSTFTFSTGVLTGANNGWTQAIPAGTLPIWVTTASALASAPSTTDTIGTGEWATPQILAQNGTNGSPGSPGANALTVTAVPDTVSVPCFANGTPKAALPGFQMSVLSGTTDITGSATYTFTASGVTGVAHTGGAFTVAGLSGDTGYVDVTANGLVTKRIVYSKSLDGQAYNTVEDDTIAAPGTSYTDIGDVTILSGPAGTYTISYQVDAVVATSSTGADGYVDYSLDGGSTWATMSGSSGTWGPASPGDSLDIFHGFSASGSFVSAKQNVMFRLMMRRTGSGTLTGVGGSFMVQWNA